MHFSIYTLSDEEIFSILFSLGLLKNGQRRIIKINRSVKEEEDHEQKIFALPIQKQEAILNAGFCVFSQNSYKKSLQVKLPMLQVSVNPCCFTIFTTKENCIFFYGKMCADYHGGSGKKRLL